MKEKLMPKKSPAKTKPTFPYCPKKFSLEPETRSGFRVTKSIKKLWAVQLDLVEQLDRVCKKYNLKYSLCGGSLLGAIRHDGFIPWDDDIDLCMTRPNFDRLLKIIDAHPDEFPAPYFLQTSLNDNLFRPHAQLRNSNTTAILETDKNLDCNQGIFIDIFVFDKIPDSNLARKIFFARTKLCHKLLVNYHHRHEPPASSLNRFTRFFVRFFFKLISFKSFYLHFDRLCKKYQNRTTKECSDVMFSIKLKEDILPVNTYKNLTTHKFEHFTLPIPKNYDEVLTKMYGDYMAPVKGTQTHSIDILDTDKPYTYYLKRLQTQKTK